MKIKSRETPKQGITAVKLSEITQVSMKWVDLNHFSGIYTKLQKYAYLHPKNCEMFHSTMLHYDILV